MPLIFLHGLGQTPDSWRAAARALEADALCPDLFAAVRAGEVSYRALYRGFARFCEEYGAPLHLCGLSLGGVLALQYAVDHPERMGSLVLIGTPYVMPKRLLKVQNLVFRFLPERSFRQMGLPKRDVIALTRSMMDLDFREDLGQVECPTLVLCGERDGANRKAADGLRQHLPDAELAWIPGAGHEANVDAPDALAAVLAAFYRRIGAL